ncbi:MAG TPA: RNA polymerase sigma-70 factor [Cyclobacteriaceae bacterium]|nr:RNA polymerase sigma-70 factor [Cyclobacteriaceae bacterium]
MQHSRKIYDSDKESSLVRLLREGHADAFKEIFQLYWRDLYNHAYSKLNHKEEAEEIVQEIFTTLWSKRNELLITNLSYYLHTAVRNRVLNRIRSKTVHEKYWNYYKQFLNQSATSTEDLVNFNDLEAAVHKGISSLPEKTRTVFLLSRVNGLSTAEIARKLNLSEKAIEYHLTRSLKEVKTRLKDYLPAILVLLELL